MKKALIFLVLLFITSLTYSSFGQKCKWKTEEIDPISDMIFLESKKITQAKTVVVGDEPRSISIQFIKKGEVFKLKTYTALAIVLDEKIENAQFKIKLDDGTLLTFLPENISTFYDGSIIVVYEFQIEKSDLILLAQSESTAFQSSFNAVEVTFKLKKKVKSKIIDYANCLIKSK